MLRHGLLIPAVLVALGCRAKAPTAVDNIEPPPATPVWNVQVLPDSDVFHLFEGQSGFAGQLYWLGTVGATVVNSGPATIYLSRGCQDTGSEALSFFRARGDSTANGIFFGLGCVTLVESSPSNATTTPPRTGIPSGGSYHFKFDVRSIYTTDKAKRAEISGPFQIAVDLRSSDGVKSGAGYNLLAPDSVRTTRRFQIAVP